MSFKASNALPAHAYDEAKRVAVQLKNFCDARASNWAAGSNAAQILAAVDNLNAFKTRLETVSVTPGIAAYARDQENDQNYNVVSEFAAMRGALDTAITQIVAAVPKDANGYILMYEISANGDLIPRTFSGAALVNVIANLSAISATIS